MATQETVRVTADLIFTTDNGEVPDTAGFERLIADQMAGELDETTGLGCMAVTVANVTGDLAPDTTRLEAALRKAAKGVYRDSNDGEIDALRDALCEALALAPVNIDTDKIDAEALAWAESKDLI